MHCSKTSLLKLPNIFTKCTRWLVSTLVHWASEVEKATSPTCSGWPGRPFFFNPLLTPVVKVFHPLNLKFYQIIFSQTNASSRFHASLRKQLTLFSWCCHWFSPWNDVRETGRNSLLMPCHYLGLCGCRFSLLKGTQIWVVHQIGRATWQICFNQSDALPRSRLWCIISVEYQCLFLRPHLAENQSWRCKLLLVPANKGLFVHLVL